MQSAPLSRGEQPALRRWRRLGAGRVGSTSQPEAIVMSRLSKTVCAVWAVLVLAVMCAAFAHTAAMRSAPDAVPYMLTIEEQVRAVFDFDLPRP